MVITHKLRVDADCLVVLCTMEEVGVCAGQAAIARLTARLSAVVRIPVFGFVIFSDPCAEAFEVFAFYCVTSFSDDYLSLSGADGLIVYLNVFFFSAILIDGKEVV